eukprot:gene42219-52346_t
MDVSQFPTSPPTIYPTIAGDVWKPSNAPHTQFFAVASSASGQYVVATSGSNSKIRHSSDFGATWSVQTDNSYFITNVASDRSGQYLVTGMSSGFYMWSSNFGSSWTQRTYGGFNTVQNDFVALDGSGRRMVVASGAGIWMSTNYAASFHKVFNLTLVWSGVCSDDSGQYLTAISSGSGQQGGIYSSQDYGAAWTLSVYSADYRSVASSGTGQWQAAAIYGVGITISSDFGVNWALSGAAALNWVSVDLDDTGRKLVAAVYNGGLYSSENRGVNWTLTTFSPSKWKAVVSDSRGEQFVAVSEEDGIYYQKNSTDAMEI